LDKEHIWVVGTTNNWERGIILRKNKEKWETVYYTEPGDKKIGRFYSLWTDRESLIYLNGVSGRCIYNFLLDTLDNGYKV